MAATRSEKLESNLGHVLRVRWDVCFKVSLEIENPEEPGYLSGDVSARSR